MDFSSLVLMERDKESKMLVKELGSYEVSEGAEYISKMYCEDEIVYIYFDTKRDVEEWEYSAIYDLFNEEAFENLGYNLEFLDEEYNPTWKFSFKYVEDYIEMKEKLSEICTLIETEMNSVFENIIGKENEYI